MNDWAVTSCSKRVSVSVSASVSADGVAGATVARRHGMAPEGTPVGQHGSPAAQQAKLSSSRRRWLYGTSTPRLGHDLVTT